MTHAAAMPEHAQAPAVRLAPRFDAALLHADFLRIQPGAARAAGFEGEGHRGWEAVTVFSDVDPDAARLADAPYVRALLDGLALDLKLARFMVLAPGGEIRPHRDVFLSAGFARLHIPVVTHPEVRFFIDGQRCHWEAGECWYGDFTRVHHGTNSSTVTRVHLVLDVLANEALAALFPGAQLPDRMRAAMAADAAPADAACYAFGFRLPKGFALPGLGFAPTAAELDGSVDLRDGSLWVSVGGQPLLQAHVAKPGELVLSGLDLALAIRCELRGGRVSSATLCSADGVLRVPLPVTEQGALAAPP
jgi:hypothetical protein